MRGRKTVAWGMAACVALAAAGAAYGQATNAAEKTDPYVGLAVTRARVEVALRDAAALFDERRSEWRTTCEAVEEVWGHIARTIEQAAGEEERKLEDVRDEKFMEFCGELHAAKERDWQLYERRREGLAMRYEDAVNVYQQLRETFDVLGELDSRWKAAGLDLGVLAQNYAALSQGLDRASKDVRDAFADHAALLADWQKALKDVAKKTVNPQ